MILLPQHRNYQYQCFLAKLESWFEYVSLQFHLKQDACVKDFLKEAINIMKWRICPTLQHICMELLRPLLAHQENDDYDEHETLTPQTGGSTPETLGRWQHPPDWSHTDSRTEGSLPSSGRSPWTLHFQSCWSPTPPNASFNIKTHTGRVTTV